MTVTSFKVKKCSVHQENKSTVMIPSENSQTNYSEKYAETESLNNSLNNSIHSKPPKSSSKAKLTSVSRRFRMAFDKSLDKLFPETSNSDIDNDVYLHPMGMQPFMSTSCHVTMIGAGAHPRMISKKYWRSFPEMASSSDTLDKVDSSNDSLTKS